MCEGSRKEFGLMQIPVADLKVIYAYGLDGRINKEFAENFGFDYIDIPLIIDKNNYIIDGNHRYWFLIKNDYKLANVIKLNITFEESKPWRQADVGIKQFAKLIDKPELYEKFKELVSCLK